MWNGHMANFAPRVGLVWNPHGDGRDTLRVGGAILYDVAETWFNERETTNAPIGTKIDTPNPVGGFSNPWQGYPGGNPFPQNGKAFFPTAGVYVNMPINPKPTYVAQWNVTYQRQIGKLDGVRELPGEQDHSSLERQRRDQSGRVSGSGLLHDQRHELLDLLHHLATPTSGALLYLANPTLGAAYASINTIDDGAVAHYKGLLLSLQHRFSHGFTFGDELHRLVLRLRHRFRRRAGDAGKLAALQPACRLGSVRLRYPAQLQRLDGGHEFPDERQPVDESAAEGLAGRAAVPRLQRPAVGDYGR